MISFSGIRKIDNIPHIIFHIKINNEIKECAIPSDDITCHHIMSYLQKYTSIIPKTVESDHNNNT